MFEFANGPFQPYLVAIILIAIAINVFYLLNLRDLLKEIDPTRRKVEPSNVWLMFIPVFSLVYAFILYPRISDSVKSEFSSRGRTQAGDCAKGMGITIAALSICTILPYVGGFIGMANLMIKVVYWIQMSDYKNRLRITPIRSESRVGMGQSIDILDS